MTYKAFAEVIFDIFMKDLEFCAGHRIDSALEPGCGTGLEQDLVIVWVMGR